jgi:hypothetical protein
VPEVDGVGEEWVVLDSVPDEADEDGGAKEVLAFGALGCTLMAGAGVGSWVTLAGATVGWELVAVALARVNSAVASPPVTVYKLNLNLGTVSGSPVRSQ